jgi:DNA-directed RNA polymerase specialized sigma24 family protein
VQNGGRLLAGFLGDSDYSVLAFLGRTSMNVVSDFHRSQQAEKRQAAVISFEEARHALKGRELSGELDIASILGWIDIQRLVQSDPDRKHARRNLLVFQLHYIEGLTPEEISHHPGFDLSKSSAEKTIKNLRVKLQEWIGQ